MLWRLAEEEYVVQLDEPGRRYALTPRLVAVAGQWLEHSELPRLATPFVALLHARTSLTAHLVAPSYDRVVCLVHSNEAAFPSRGCASSSPRTAPPAARRCWPRASGGVEPAQRALRAYTERTVTEPGAVEREASRDARARLRDRGRRVPAGRARRGGRGP